LKGERLARLRQQSAQAQEIPKSFQPLLTFPLHHDAATTTAPRASADIITNQEGKCAIWMADFEGAYRYVAETSPLSLLYECRNIFRQYCGTNEFAEDLQACPIVDKPYSSNWPHPVDLPPRAQFDRYVETFFAQINDMYFIFDLAFLTDLANDVYADPGAVTYKAVVVYLVSAISSLYDDFSTGGRESPTTARYFRRSQYLTSQIDDFDDFWLVLIYYTTHFYYLGVCRKSTSWIYLNMAIKHAQALGLHRNFIVEQFSDQVKFRKQIFRSLYISDRVFALIHGRPLAIHDYDWDELRLIQQSSFSNNSTQLEKCQMESAKICAIISRIIDNFYRDRVIDGDRTKKLAVELKLWSYNLDKDLNIEALLNSTKPQPISRCLLLMHLLNLYGIMLLSRPFYMFESISRFNKSTKSDSLTKEFHQAAIKASVLCITLVNFYVNLCGTRFYESAVVSNCCFFAALLIGTEILSQSKQDNSEYMDTLKIAKNLLTSFGVTFETAGRYGEIIENMVEALVRSKHPAKPEYTISWDLADLKFLGDLNGNLQSMLEFQQGFVPKEIASIGDFIGPNANTESVIKTDLPYNYVNYELFFGDKY